MKRTAIVVLWLASLAAAYHAGSKQQIKMVEKTLVRIDTMRIVQPEVMVVHDKGSMTVSLPLADNSSDSAEVEMRIEQAVYADSSYRAYVSGFLPRLDSLVFIKSTHKTLFSEKKNARRWHIGVQAGCGITPRGVQPYIGFGISFRIL